MDIILRVCALGITCGIISSLLKKNSPELLTASTAAGIIVLVAATTGVVSGVIDIVHELAGFAGIGDELLRPLIKCVGISIVVKMGTDVCKDSGALTFASYIELIGGAVALLIAAPLMTNLLSQITV